jgi:superfamily II DNA helicase RecQ
MRYALLFLSIPPLLSADTLTIQEITTFQYDILLSGPEMALYHPRFSRATRNSKFMSHFEAFIFDEAHCIPQWGTNFREIYFEVGRLRSYFPEKCPVLATTATATPEDVDTIEKILHFQRETMYYCNLGNDRPNIRQTVKVVGSPREYSEIELILDQTGPGEEWPCTMIFTNTIEDARNIMHALQHRYPERRSQIDSYFSRRRRSTKKKVMDRFREGKTRILCTTEAAGMASCYFL